MIEPSIWHQGERLEGEAAASLSRRSHLYGDSLFETMVADANGIHFWELHYFRLMASMRIMRMSIPQAWSPDALADELLACVDTAMPCRLRLAVWRQGGLGYMPSESTIEWAMHVDPLENGPYPLPVKRIELGMFQDHLKAKGLLSNVKMGQSALFVLAMQFAKENNHDDSVILNVDKMAIESCQANLFILSKDKVLRTAPLSEGPLRGTMRQAIITLAPMLGLTVIEEAVSPFALQRAEELWLSNAVKGVQAVSTYRKSRFGKTMAELMQALIAKEAVLQASIPLRQDGAILP